MLSHEDTLALIKLAQNGDDDAKAKLIETNMPLVKSIAKRFYGRLEFDDLMQLGAMGFVKAINNFDPTFEVRFSTYAVPMIMGEIKRFIRDDGTVKVSRALKTLSFKISRYVEDFKNSKLREPSLEEIAAALTVDVHDVVFALDASKMVISIYAESEENGGTLIDRLITDSHESDETLNKILMKEIINTLPEREKKIIILRYFRDKTQSEVAREMGVSQVQVSRLEGKILQKLKDGIA
ncbi:MAG: SigB/SigF/SigG family RNA polymerase sigma factor [Clostridia bacterium]|nr:SigB/SigF/SigG family RNA polymerase sigma factor [Clostridia bacterium]